jgi:hypothetical protein
MNFSLDSLRAIDRTPYISKLLEMRSQGKTKEAAGFCPGIDDIDRYQTFLQACFEDKDIIKIDLKS